MSSIGPSLSALWDDIESYRTRTIGKCALHSTVYGKRRSSVERRRLLSAYPEIEYVASEDDPTYGHAHVSCIRYAEHCSATGDVIDERIVSCDDFLKVLREKASLVITSNPASLVGFLPLDDYRVKRKTNNPVLDMDRSNSGNRIELLHVRPPVFSHDFIKVFHFINKRRHIHTEFWSIEGLTANQAAVHNEQCQPCFELIRDAFAEWVSAITHAGLRGEDGGGAIRMTPASQAKFAFLSDFYERSDGAIISPPLADDFYATGKTRYMTPETMMPDYTEHFPVLYHYDLNSAYLNILRGPLPAVFKGSYKADEIASRGITLRHLREYLPSMLWIAEVELQGLEVGRNDNAAVLETVSKWVSNTDMADFDSLYPDDLVPSYVSIWKGGAVMRRFAEHMIAARASSVSKMAVKAVGVTAHMGLGYVPTGYQQVQYGSKLYRECVENPHMINFKVGDEFRTLRSKSEFLNRPKRRTKHQHVYGRKCPISGELKVYVEKFVTADNSAPHIGGWPLMVCSARILNLIQAANRSGCRVVWVHTDGIRVDKPIDVAHYPEWLIREPELMDVHVERDICLWPDGTRMVGPKIDVKPGCLVQARSGGMSYVLPSKYRRGPQEWARKSFIDTLSLKSSERGDALKAGREEQLEQAFKTHSAYHHEWERPAPVEGQHIVFDYHNLGL